jgi:hypothetical protein
MIVGITGHQKLEEKDCWLWVGFAVRTALAEIPRPLVGVSSLAIGTDQLFAELVLKSGGSLEVVVPFPDYWQAFTPGQMRSQYQALLNRATRVDVLPARGSREESYLAAGQLVVERSDLMIAVWNGRAAAGLGGTGDIVRYARQLNRKVLHVDPFANSR